MMSSILQLAGVLERSPLAETIRENDVLFPAIESVHVLSVCLVVGSILVVDLRLLGLASLPKNTRNAVLAVALLVMCAPFAVGADTVALQPPFRPYVDMKTFMEHIVAPASAHIWSVNVIIIDAQGEHNRSPQSDADWEELVTAAAILAESTNALLIAQRKRDRDRNGYVRQLADAANRAYRAAEARDLKAIAAVSDQLDGICASCHRHYKLE